MEPLSMGNARFPADPRAAAGRRAGASPGIRAVVERGVSWVWRSCGPAAGGACRRPRGPLPLLLRRRVQALVSACGGRPLADDVATARPPEVEAPGRIAREAPPATARARDDGHPPTAPHAPVAPRATAPSHPSVPPVPSLHRSRRAARDVRALRPKPADRSSLAAARLAVPSPSRRVRIDRRVERPERCPSSTRSGSSRAGSSRRSACSELRRGRPLAARLVAGARRARRGCVLVRRDPADRARARRRSAPDAGRGGGHLLGLGDPRRARRRRSP